MNNIAPPSKPTIFIVDDNQPLAEALEIMLEAEGFIIKSFNNAKDFLDYYRFDTLSCLILDVRMPGMSGDKLQAELIACEIKIPIIFISGYSDVDVVVGALRNGAIDFIPKPIDHDRLMKGISKALQQDQHRRLQEKKDEQVQQRVQLLTKREFEVLTLMVHGLSTKAIATQLVRSEHTIENHRTHIMKKMQVKSIAELVALCILNSVVEWDDASHTSASTVS